MRQLYFSTRNTELFQIGRTERAEPRAVRTLADKFFLAGALGIFVGGAGLGVHLWLMLNGWMNVPVTYGFMRELHALVQFYLFFGLFILGFIFQSAARLFEIRTRPKQLLLASIPALFGAAALQYLYPGLLINRLLLALPFLLGALFVAELLPEASSAKRTSFGWWFLLSLCAFAVAPLYTISSAPAAMVFFWLAAGSPLIAVGQQMIGGVLGGRMPSTAEMKLLLVNHLAAALCLVLGASALDQYFVRAAALFMLLEFSIFYRATALFSFSARATDVLGLAFRAAYVWGMAGALLLLVFGLAGADSALHAWAVGWGATLVIAVSTHVLGGLSGRPVMGSRTASTVLILWQIVALGRLRVGPFIPHPNISLVVACAATLVLIVWPYGLIRSALALKRRLEF